MLPASWERRQSKTCIHLFRGMCRECEMALYDTLVSLSLMPLDEARPKPNPQPPPVERRSR